MSGEGLGMQCREDMLAKANRPTAIVGATVPIEAVVGGERVPLRSVISAFARLERPTAGEVADARRMAGVLEREAEALSQSLLIDPDMTLAKAEAICANIVGLRRASADLKSVGRRREYDAKSLTASEVEDAKRWMEFLKGLR